MGYGIFFDTPYQMKLALLFLFSFILLGCSDSGDSSTPAPQITIINQGGGDNSDEVKTGEDNLVNDDIVVIVEPPVKKEETDNTGGSVSEDDAVLDEPLIDNNGFDIVVPQEDEVVEVEEEQRPIIEIPNIVEKGLDETASEFIESPEILEQENLLRENVREIVESDEFDLNRALLEIDLIEFELTKLGCEFDVEIVFEGFVLIRYRGEFKCPRRMDKLARSKAIYQMNSYLYLAGNIPNELLELNQKHLLVVKIRELGRTNNNQIKSAVEDLSRMVSRFERNQSTWLEMSCVFTDSCEPTDSQLSSINTITNQCELNFREIGIYSRIWPILDDIPYIEMESFFIKCKTDGKRILEKYNFVDDDNDDPSITEPDNDLAIEFRCYSNASMRIRLYCQRMRNRITEWINEDDAFADLFVRRRIGEVLIDESSSKNMQQVSGMLIVFKEYSDKAKFFSDLSQL